MPRESMPILRRGRRGGFRIPWAVIAPHERQAQRNHDQSLDQLAERGGLSCAEALAILEDRPFRPMDENDAQGRVMEHIAAVAYGVPVHALPGREQRLAAAFLRLLDAYEKGTDAGASDRPDWVRDAVHDANGVRSSE